MHYLIGIFFLVLSKIKYHLKAYSPKPIVDIDGSVNYAFQVVEHWIRFLRSKHPDFSYEKQNILELGPGSDLGIASILLAKGAEKYYAYDIHDLVQYSRQEFYTHLFQRISSEIGYKNISESELHNLVKNYSNTGCGKINYICKNNIDFAEIADGEITLVVSQAALEHYSDLNYTFSLLASKCKGGATFVAEVDLKAHSRWVRDYDPLNIYYYNSWLYKLLSHKATPNRLRPHEYKKFLEDNGWRDVQIIRLKNADPGYFCKAKPRMQKRFQDEYADSLSIMLIATKQ